MSRSAISPYLAPLGLVLAAHLLWLAICGGFSAMADLLGDLLLMLIL